MCLALSALPYTALPPFLHTWRLCWHPNSRSSPATWTGGSRSRCGYVHLYHMCVWSHIMPTTMTTDYDKHHTHTNRDPTTAGRQQGPFLLFFLLLLRPTPHHHHQRSVRRCPQRLVDSGPFLQRGSGPPPRPTLRTAGALASLHVCVLMRVCIVLDRHTTYLRTHAIPQTGGGAPAHHLQLRRLLLFRRGKRRLLLRERAGREPAPVSGNLPASLLQRPAIPCLPYT